MIRDLLLTLALAALAAQGICRARNMERERLAWTRERMELVADRDRLYARWGDAMLESQQRQDEIWNLKSEVDTYYWEVAKLRGADLDVSE